MRPLLLNCYERKHFMMRCPDTRISHCECLLCTFALLGEESFARGDMADAEVSLSRALALVPDDRRLIMKK